jgi:hypothetical protein
MRRPQGGAKDSRVALHNTLKLLILAAEILRKVRFTAVTKRLIPASGTAG